MPKSHILVVEDDDAISRLISTALTAQGYLCKIAANGTDALHETVSWQPDVLILDLGLPDMDGVEIIRKVRSWSTMPILVVSARSEATDMVLALDAGADGYVTKPFSVEELMARTRAALRRVRFETEQRPDRSSQYSNGALRIDYTAGCVYLNDAEVHLTPLEYKLLVQLAQNTGKVLTHNYLLKEVWGSVLPGDTPSLRVFMATLRKKIEPDPSRPRYIQTKVGVGYRMLHVSEDEDADTPL